MNWILFLKSWAIQSVLSRLPHWQYSKCPGTPNDNTYVLVPHWPCRRGVTCNPFTPTRPSSALLTNSAPSKQGGVTALVRFFFFFLVRFRHLTGHWQDRVVLSSLTDLFTPFPQSPGSQVWPASLHLLWDRSTTGMTDLITFYSVPTGSTEYPVSMLILAIR